MELEVTVRSLWMLTSVFGKLSWQDRGHGVVRCSRWTKGWFCVSLLFCSSLLCDSQVLLFHSAVVRINQTCMNRTLQLSCFPSLPRLSFILFFLTSFLFIFYSFPFFPLFLFILPSFSFSSICFFFFFPLRFSFSTSVLLFLLPSYYLSLLRSSFGLQFLISFPFLSLPPSPSLLHILFSFSFSCIQSVHTSIPPFLFSLCPSAACDFPPFLPFFPVKVNSSRRASDSCWGGCPELICCPLTFPSGLMPGTESL